MNLVDLREVTEAENSYIETLVGCHTWCIHCIEYHHYQ